MCWRSATIDSAGGSVTAGAIDMHAHLFVPEVEQLVQGMDGAEAEAQRQATLLGGASQSYNASMFAAVLPRLTDPVVRLDDMDRLGIARQLVSPSPTQFHYWAEPALAAQIVALQNDAVLAQVAADPARLAGLGTVALQHPQLAVEQLAAALKAGLRGVQVSTRIEGRDIFDPAFDPFWSAAEALGALVFVHPYGCSLGERIAPWYLSNILGQPVETSIALAGLVLSGTLERHPRLKLLAAHGGGYLAAQSGRLDHGWHARPETRTTSEPPSHYLGRVHYDSLLHAPDELAMLVRKVGAEQVVLGTDYPFDMGAYDHGALLAASGLGQREYAAILQENAERLLNEEEVSCAV
jgi:aminocarboxymuconate-semialdehyde decarboxylase